MSSTTSPPNPLEPLNGSNSNSIISISRRGERQFALIDKRVKYEVQIMAKDIYHNTVRTALEKDRWIITQDRNHFLIINQGWDGKS